MLLPLPGWTMLWPTREQQLVELPAPTCSLKVQGADFNVQYSASAQAVASCCVKVWHRFFVHALYRQPKHCQVGPAAASMGLSAYVTCNLMPSASLSKPYQTHGLIQMLSKHTKCWPELRLRDVLHFVPPVHGLQRRKEQLPGSEETRKSRGHGSGLYI